MNKEQLFSTPLKTEIVEAFGQSFTLQEMSGIRFSEFMKEFEKDGSIIEKGAIIIAFSVVDDKGNLVFNTDDDMANLLKLPYVELEKLAGKCSSMSNLKGEEKN